MNSVATIVVGLVITVAGGLLTAWVWRLLRDRISIVRVESDSPALVDELLDLYQQRFLNDPANYSIEELQLLLSTARQGRVEPGRHVPVENIALGAQHDGHIVAFVLCHYYPERQKAIVSYMAIDKASLKARQGLARRRLVIALKKRLTARRCEYLFYDLEGVDPHTSSIQRRRREARMLHFVRAAATAGLKAYELDLDYHPAKVSLEDDEPKYPLRLWCVPLTARLPARLPRNVVLDFLRFVYLDCYGDIYPTDDPRHVEHQEYLRGIVSRYERQLPEFVPVGRVSRTRRPPT